MFDWKDQRKNNLLYIIVLHFVVQFRLVGNDDITKSSSRIRSAIRINRYHCTSIWELFSYWEKQLADGLADKLLFEILHPY